MSPESLNRYNPIAARVFSSIFSRAVPFAPYEIEKWSTNGQLERVLRREAAWFPARTEEFGPTVRAIREGGDGYLWVSIVVPSDKWSVDRIQGPMDLRKCLTQWSRCSIRAPDA